ncbi:MAG: protein rep [Parafilimonas sp.]
MENKHSAKLSESSLNTLAQSKTGYNTHNICYPLIISGHGTELNNKDAMQRRAKRKMITQSTVLSLIKVAEERGATERGKSYWNTYHCQNRIYKVDGKLYGKYCKNRFCTLCCAIRKAELINKYLPVIRTWTDPQFLTLTIKSVSAERLSVIMRKMVQGFQIIKAKYSKKNQRGQANKLIGIRSLECNFNPKRKTYNPHWHFILPDKNTADLILQEWMQLWNRKQKKWTHEDAQYVRPVKSSEKDLVEVIKYGAKIFSDPEGRKRPPKGSKRMIYALALDNIYCAMKGLRLFERFGFNVPAIKKNSLPSRVVTDYEEWIYSVNKRSWINEHEETLFKFYPSLNLLDLLEYNIDITIQ